MRAFEEGMEIISVILLGGVVIWCLRQRARTDEIEQRLAAVVRDTASFERVRDLERRVALLETSAARDKAPPQFTAAPARVIAPVPRRVREPKPEPAPVATEDHSAEPTLFHRLRSMVGDEGWEVLVGGSILNKVGAIVLVIGIALFLSWSFAHVSAAVRASMALVTSAAILGAGVRTERRTPYRVFSRGLIGAGWAGLYASAYAIYAIPASRIIHNPLLGSMGVFAVALGMVAHSLRYRSQAVTATAYFAAFAALAVSPSTPLATASLIPLAGSLLYLAARFRWNGMALFGLVSTWLTCAARAQTAAPLAETQSLFLVYWLLFDGFDLLRTHRRVDDGASSLIFTANLSGFLGLSYRLWSSAAPDRLWFAAALGASLFLCDTAVRLIIRPPSSFAPEEDFAERVRAGSYEASLFVSAVLAGLAITGRAYGIWEVAALAVEAELLYLAGARVHSVFLRGLGIVGFMASLALTATTQGKDQRTTALLFHAALFYWNRSVRRQDRMMSFVATFLVAAAIAIKAPTGYLGIAESGLAVIVLAAGLAGVPDELRFCYGPLAAAGALIAAGEHASEFMRFPIRAVWVDLAATAIAAWLATWLWSLRAESFMKHASAWLAATATLVTLWLVTPDPWWSMLGCAIAVALFETRFQWQALGVIAVIWCGQFEPGLQHARLPAVPMVMACLYWLWHRLGRAGLPAILFSYAAAAAGVFFIGREANDHQTSAFLAIFALGLLAAGIRLSAQDIRVEGYIVATLALLGSLVNNVDPPHLAWSTITAAGIYGCAALSRGAGERRAAAYLSSIASLLVMAILWGEVSGGLLTTCWALTGLALLVTGFVLHGRTLRLEGLGLLLVCILKAFLYDLRNLETIYRILSFVVLGLILLAVSWIYTRFRDHVHRLLR
jgi:hypothetical protein